MIGAEEQLSAQDAETLIKQIVEDTEKVFFSNHAKERQEERDIIDMDVFNILRKGYVNDDPTLNENGDWECKIIYKLRGSRTAGVVVVFFVDGELLIKTVEWEDW